MRSGSRAIATSPPSCGTRPASARPTASARRAAIEPPAATLAVNRWIVGETVKTVQALDLALAELRFDESANTIYHFVWATFCDWYLELIKPVLQIDEDGGG